MFKELDVIKNTVLLSTTEQSVTSMKSYKSMPH